MIEGCQGTAIDGERCPREELAMGSWIFLFIGLVFYLRCRRPKTCPHPWLNRCLWTLDMDRCRIALGPSASVRVCLTLARLDDPQPAMCQHPAVTCWMLVPFESWCRRGESWCVERCWFDLGVCHDFYLRTFHERASHA